MFSPDFAREHVSCVTDAALYHSALNRPFSARLGLLALLTHVPDRLLRRSAPHAHVVELIADKHLGVAANVQACCGDLRPDDFDAATRGHVPYSDRAVAATADNELALCTQCKSQHSVCMALQNKLTHVTTAGCVEETDGIVEGAANDDWEMVTFITA